MGRTAESTSDFDAVSRIPDALHTGELVLVHDFDDRGGETDLVYPTGTVGPADVARVRNDASGLVCVALPNDVLKPLGLPFMNDVLDHPATSFHGPVYDSQSSFFFTVNHRDSFIGITDRDRVMTVSRLAFVAEAARVDEHNIDGFGSEFRVSGHVYLFHGASSLFSDRRGYAELGLALADEMDISLAAVVCEMLSDETDTTLPKNAAHDYADRRGFTFVDGDGLIDKLV